MNGIGRSGFPPVRARTAPTEPWAPAFLLEAKRFVASGDGAAVADAAGGRGEANSVCSTSIWCFVVWRDRPRRLAAWLPSRDVDADGSGEGGLINEPIVSHIATTQFPLPKRHAAPTVLAFLEDRLGRDMRSPVCFRYFRYLGFVFPPWYYAPYGLLYPDFHGNGEVLRDAFLCPFTLAVYATQRQLERAVARRAYPHCTPPGVEIYRDEVAGVSVLEVDGARHRVFCRNLFLVCKSFLDNKLAGHDVDMYVFYVLCVHAGVHAPHFCTEPRAMLFAGFYSWEKDSREHNLACIVTLPCFQGYGFGNFLIALSYENAYRRRFVGTPERPLSDLGAAAYERFWWTHIARFLHKKTTSQWVVGPVAATATATTATAAEGTRATSAAASEQQQQQQRQDDDETPLVHSTSVREIAKRVRLDENDVLETLLRNGLIHRTEKRELRVVVPVDLVASVDARYRAATSQARGSVSEDGDTTRQRISFDSAKLRPSTL